ncbi:MAG: hypothetical protein Q9179_002106 [Wetmoreana sp. 5 TL-2023]
MNPNMDKDGRRSVSTDGSSNRLVGSSSSKPTNTSSSKPASTSLSRPTDSLSTTRSSPLQTQDTSRINPHTKHNPQASRKRQRSPETSQQEPPRPRKRPGGTSRIDSASKNTVLQRQQAREDEAKAAAAIRGVHDAIRQHYNAVPQRGRRWRKTESSIKGLRSFNNWVKSTIIHKFSPNTDESHYGDPLRVLDIGCGKGGDLGKWEQAPQEVGLYVGIDPAEVSIKQARERYVDMRQGAGRGGRGGRGGKLGPQHLFAAEFIVQDAFSQSIENIPVVQHVGFDAKGGSRWGGGGFDVVSMMFCMHYAFEDEWKTRGILQNIAGALKKGGRFIGTIPNSDVIGAKVREFHKQQTLNLPKPQANGTGKAAAQAVAEINGDALTAPQTSATEAEPLKPRIPTPEIRDTETEDDAVASWGNSIYRVRFPGKTAHDGIFRPPFGWKYNYFLKEAVEVPEYVVPWEAFRALAEDYNLELQYRKPFREIWREEKHHPVFGPLSERMGVINQEGELTATDEEMEAAGFYHAFCFYKV